MHGWSKSLLRAVLRVLFRVQVTGAAARFDAARFDAAGSTAGRLLIVANHESFLDGLLLWAFLPVTPLIVVHTEVLKNPVFRWALRRVEHVAVDPISPLAMKRVVRAVQSGRPVLIFPEGRITTTGSLMKVYDGPAMVAARTGAVVLPVRIDGLTESYFSRMSARYPRKLLPRATLAFQPARALPMPAGDSAKQRRRRAGEALRRLMQDMLFAAQPRQTLYGALLDAIALYGRRHALYEDVRARSYRYGELLKMTLALGRLGARLAGPGEAIGVLLPNLASTVCLIVGLGAQQRTPALLNYTAGAQALAAACAGARVRTVLTSREFIAKAKLENALLGLADLRLVYLEDLRAEFSARDKFWLLAYALRAPRLFERAPDPERAAAILFTSGSEGTPKGVVLSHRALLANIAQIRAVIDFSVEDKVLTVLPLFHAFGLTAGALLPLVTGTPAFIYPSPLHYKIIPEIAYDRGCTVLYGTSTFLGQYAKAAHPYDFHKMRYVVAGAEKLAESVRALWFEKFGIRILEGYGATECAPVLAVNTPMAYRAGSVGQLLPGIEARLEAVPGIETGGLLHVRGPNLMSGYLRAERPGVLEPPASSQGAGWYNTGDVATLDEDGFLTLRGRVKRFAKVAGEMVSLETVEAIAQQAAAAGRHAALAVPDPERGEAIVLYTDAVDLTRERLKSAQRALGASELALPRRIIALPEIPLLGTGKVDYQTLRSRPEPAAAPLRADAG